MRWLAALGCLVLGVVTALAGVLLHQMWWGLALGFAVGGLLWWSLPPYWIHRFMYGVGWVVVAALAATPRGAGDYLVPANVSGYAFLVWATGLAVAGLLAPRALSSTRATTRAATPGTLGGTPGADQSVSGGAA